MSNRRRMNEWREEEKKRKEKNWLLKRIKYTKEIPSYYNTHSTKIPINRTRETISSFFSRLEHAHTLQLWTKKKKQLTRVVYDIYRCIHNERATTAASIAKRSSVQFDACACLSACPPARLLACTCIRECRWMIILLNIIHILWWCSARRLCTRNFGELVRCVQWRAIVCTQTKWSQIDDPNRCSAFSQSASNGECTETFRFVIITSTQWPIWRI